MSQSIEPKLDTKVPRVLILGSGTPTGGGSGPGMLVEKILQDILPAEIVGLVTHYPNGGVAALGKKHEDLFQTYVIEDFPTRKKGEAFTPEQLETIRSIYADMIEHFGGIDSIDYILCSGWMKYILGLPVEKTINIHPARVDEDFGGEGKYGDAAHQHAFKAYKNGEIKYTAITMHFVDEQFDHGAVIAQQLIPLHKCESWEEAKSRVVGPTEHAFQLAVTKAILEGYVRLENGVAVWDPNFEFEIENYHKGSVFWNLYRNDW